jgi:uncharacterized protein (TIGR00269 family)
VEKRARKELRRQLRLKGSTRLAVGLSGGKDSSVVLALVHSILGSRPDVEILAVTVDEGIGDYRPPGIESASRLCEELGVEHHVARCKDAFGYGMDEVVAMDERAIPCSYCGVFRRSLLNREARRLEAGYLVMGLNLDDTAQSALMNFVRNDLERMARMGPHDTVQEALVPRVQPLRTVPEKEVYLYAIVNRIPFHDAVCPYAGRAQRGLYREVLARMEERFPGSRHSILKSCEALRPGLREAHPPAALSRCGRCGEPTIRDVCRACFLVERLES